MKHILKLFITGSLLFSFANVEQVHSLSTFIGLGGGGSTVSALQSKFGWDFHAKGGFLTTYFDVSLSLGAVGVQSKIDPITGKAVSGVTTAGGSFEKVQEEVTYSIYLVPIELFFTGKYPVYKILYVTATFGVGYLFDINTRGGFLDALGSVSTPPADATPIETRNTVTFEGLSLMALGGIELDFGGLYLFVDLGYRYSEPRIRTEVPAKDADGASTSKVVTETFKQDASGFTVRAGIKFKLL